MSTNTICLGGVSLIIGRHAAAEIPKELEKAGCRHPLLVTDGSILKLGLCRELLEALEQAGIPWAVFSDVPSDPPSSVVAKGTDFCRSQGCDSVIGLGGGSVLDCAKAIKMMCTHSDSILDYVKGGSRFQNPGLPLFSVPTTSGTGSEVTQYAVITDEKKQLKTTIGDTRLVSRAVFLDPTLTQGLPPRITAATALDALAHAIEAYTSNRVLNAGGSSAFSDTLDLEAIRRITRSLPIAVTHGSNLEARLDVMIGATMAGLVSQAGSGSAHGIGAGFGAMYHVPHGEAVGIFLPYVMAYNLPACPDRFRDIALAMGVNVLGLSPEAAGLAAVTRLRELLEEVHFVHLRDYVKTEAELPALAEKALVDHCNSLNAIPLTRLDQCNEILTHAWHETL